MKKINSHSVLRHGISKVGLISAVILGTFSSSFATLQECFNTQNLDDYERGIKYCEPYAKKDYKATEIVGAAYLGKDYKKTVDYSQWVVDYFNQNNLNSVDDVKVAGYAYGILGDIYYFGREQANIPAEPKKGLEYYTKSADLGNNIAQKQLGDFYNSSSGRVISNASISYKWYQIAILNGNSEARNSELMSQIDEAAKLAPYCIAMGKQLVAEAYITGDAGLTQNNSKAKDYLNEAIELYKTTSATKENLEYCPEGADKLNLDSAEKTLGSL